MDRNAALDVLQHETGWLAAGESDYQPHYWNLHHAQRPRDVRAPDEYTGGADLAIACTQLEMPASQQRRLVAQWVEVLPTLHGVQRLWFSSRVPQELFDAACRMPGLTDLWIKWSGITTLDAVAGLRGLLRFHLGESARLASLQPLVALPQLQWLWLDGMAKIPGLDPLAMLRGLEGLFVAGSGSKALVVPTLKPLAQLQGLSWLQLGALRTAADGLQPLAALRQLQYLGLPNWFEVEEFASLAAQLPHTRCSWFQPYARQHAGNFRCPKCQQRAQVFTAGKPMRRLCPACDAAPLVAQMLRFEAARAAAQAAVQGTGL